MDARSPTPTTSSGDPSAGTPDWSALRAAMPVAATWAYLDHAAVAPISAPARLAIDDWSRDLAENGAANWARWARKVESARWLAAQLLGADEAEIALVANTTAGINFVAEGFPWRDGDNVVTLADEFPSNQYPWLNLADRGVETRRLPAVDGRVSPLDVAAACDRRTRIVSVSWIGYASGWRNDLGALAEVAHQAGAYLFVDAIQGLGVFPLDVSRTPIDFLSADGHKWLLGPEGAGVFYTRREHLDLLRPIGLGWNSVVHADDFSRIELSLKPAAARYEGGTCNMPGLVGLGASLDLLAAYRLDDVAKQVIDITDYACHALTNAGGAIASHREKDHASGIVSFDWPAGDPQSVRKHCHANHVKLSCRAGRLRISPHAYNTTGDIDRLIAALRSYKSG